MDPRTRIEPIAPLIETLVSCEDPALRDRVLVEAARLCSGARGVALWHPIPSQGTACWQPVLTLGHSDGLPTDGQVRAVAEGRLSGDLGLDRHVVTLEGAGGPRALALSGALDEESLELVEGLFALARQLEAADDDPLQPPLPADPDRSATPEGLADVRHDLRNLLTTLRSACDYVERFADEMDDEECLRASDVVTRDLGRIGRLLVEALDGEPDERPSWSPAELVRDVIASLEPEFDDAGLSIAAGPLTARTSPEELCEVDARRIVENLVRNALEALRASGSGATVTLGWTDGDGHSTLTVEDDGPGLPEPVEPWFERGRTHGKAGGSGLGLGIVRDLARGSNATVRASNRAGGGARFAVRWSTAGSRRG